MHVVRRILTSIAWKQVQGTNQVVQSGQNRCRGWCTRGATANNEHGSAYLQVVHAIEAAAESLGATHKRLVSRAYHDSLFMAQLAPTGMIFIPCRQGWSHRPDEFSSPGDIGRGVHALALTLAALAGGVDDSPGRPGKPGEAGLLKDMESMPTDPMPTETADNEAVPETVPQDDPMPTETADNEAVPEKVPQDDPMSSETADNEAVPETVPQDDPMPTETAASEAVPEIVPQDDPMSSETADNETVPEAEPQEDSSPPADAEEREVIAAAKEVADLLAGEVSIADLLPDALTAAPAAKDEL